MQLSPNKPRRAVVTFRENAGVVTARDEHLDLLATRFTCRPVAFTAGGPCGYQVVRPEVPFFTRDERGQLLVRAGLATVAVALLEMHGVDVTVVDERNFDGEYFRVDDAYMGRLGAASRATAEGVLTNPVGRLVYGGYAELVQKLTVICLLYPAARILVQVRRRKDAWYMARELRRAMSEQVQAAPTKFSVKYRVVVCPFTYAQHPDEWDVVIVVDVADLTDPSVTSKMRRLLRSSEKRVYGFQQKDAQLSEYAERCVADSVGRAIEEKAGSETAKVRVLTARPVSHPATAGLDGLSYKRRAFWHNQQRNAFIISCARAVASGNRPALWEAGLFVGDNEEIPSKRPPMRVAILVEGVEHGLALSSQLPGWPLIRLEDGLCTTDRAGDYFIITLAAADAAGLPADVVIRSDGGDSATIPGVPDKKAPRVYVIDVADNFDMKTRQSRNSRLDGYRDLGWTLDNAGQRDLLNPPAEKGNPKDADRDRNSTAPPVTAGQRHRRRTPTKRIAPPEEPLRTPPTATSRANRTNRHGTPRTGGGSTSHASGESATAIS